MAITTIEDKYQYRIHKVLNNLFKEYKNDTEQYSVKGSFEDWIWVHRDELGAAVLEDIDAYCGIDEALNNEG